MKPCLFAVSGSTSEDYQVNGLEGDRVYDRISHDI